MPRHTIQLTTEDKLRLLARAGDFRLVGDDHRTYFIGPEATLLFEDKIDGLALKAGLLTIEEYTIFAERILRYKRFFPRITGGSDCLPRHADLGNFAASGITGRCYVKVEASR